MGSRILSRSFNVEKWDSAEDEVRNITDSREDEMDIDPSSAPEAPQENEEEFQHSDTEEEDEDDCSDIAMVPMADMLNARYGSENVCRGVFNCCFRA